MKFYDGATEDLRKKVKSIFESKNYKKELQETEDKSEFQFTGDVNYNIQVEDDGEYKEYYVLDEDGNIIEIFTDDMADQDGRIPSDVRQAIVAQAQSESGYDMEVEDEMENEVEDEVEDEIENEVEDEIENEVEDEVEDDEIPEGGSSETNDDEMETDELPEDYAHNVRQVNENGITNVSDTKLPITKPDSKEDEQYKKEREDQDKLNFAGVYNEENYNDERGEVPGEQDTGPDEHKLDIFQGTDEEIVNKAIEMINTDRYQVQDVLPKVPEHLQDNVLKQIRTE